MFARQLILICMSFISLSLSTVAAQWSADRCTKSCGLDACNKAYLKSQCSSNCPNFKCDATPPASIVAEPVGKAPVVKAEAPVQPLPQPPKEPVHKLSGGTYTIDEVNTLLKSLLNDQFKEVTTGCNSARTGVFNGLGMLKGDRNPEAVKLWTTGEGYIAIFLKETAEAEAQIKAFDIKTKLSMTEVKEMYQKSLAKSLLAAQDCKVKSVQFNGWLKAYFDKKEPKKKSFLGFFRKD